MSIEKIYSRQALDQMARDLFEEERHRKRLDGWFLAKEIARACDEKYCDLPPALKAAETLREVIRQIPLTLSEQAIFAGTQNDAFAMSYALINPTFRVDSFSGYCDPVAVFNDIQTDAEFSAERIQALRAYTLETPFVQNLKDAYQKVETDTSEAIYFIEQVTGHLIPDIKPVLSKGISGLLQQIDAQLLTTTDSSKRSYFEAMRITLDAVLVLAGRYAELARQMAQSETSVERRDLLKLMEETLGKVLAAGADNLYEAIQVFILVWQVMCLEQSPNPFAFSVGNADRIFEPYRVAGGTERGIAAELFKYLLVFFNVGDRSWAISQNLILGGKSSAGADLSNESTYALLDAYYEMNLPQPILSVKLHQNTPDAFYHSLGRFLFTPGVLTPSFFNDDALFPILANSGVEELDLENYSIAGCQEPLIMGRDNGNTTNSWLNLGKILELTVHGGVSSITGRQIGPGYDQLGFQNSDAKTILTNIRPAFYQNVAYFVERMVNSANEVSDVLSLLPVPFTSALMGGIESGVDLRDTHQQGTRYNGSGCLIHGLSTIADSFTAIDLFLMERPQDADLLLAALQSNFAQDEELRQYLLTCPKFGNNIEEVDREAREVVIKISELVSSQKNYLGNPFRPDWSTPSTHLLYGYWVGATPDGRKSREMLGYGIDPLYGEAQSGLGFRVLSNLNLPFERMSGGYASHFGIDPNHFSGKSYEDKGMEFREKIITPLFFNRMNKNISPFYLYVNVTTPEILRQVLENPQKYAPSGVYIVRIHGTFVNFLNLSPDIQEDIIKRLDLKSTHISPASPAVQPELLPV